VVPDGKGITNLLRIKYSKRVNRITGNELFEVLLNIANNESLKVAFIGASDSVQSKLANKVKLNFPYLSIVASISPFFNFESNPAENDKTINELINKNPDIVFIALGSPRQELWISKIKERVGAKLYMGVGSVFDFYTGEKKRAPILFQQIGFEWFWRMLHEPKRLTKRYICKDLPFFLKQIKRIKLGQRKFK
jgi:N-acetylglucosaminyldiphosphoundecaprenol N-acetyl-beta-D-mannosaminyltransferase